MPQHRETPNCQENVLVLDSTLADFLVGKQVCHTDIAQWPYKRFEKLRGQLILQHQRDLQQSERYNHEQVSIGIKPTG